MSRAWLLFMAVVTCGGATLAVTLAIPHTRVPVVGSNDFTYEEAERTLEEVTILLVDDPTLDIEDLGRDFPLLSGIEGPEPAGLGWAAVGVVTTLLGALAWSRAGNRFGWYLIAVGAVAATLGGARAVADLAVRSEFGTTFGSQVAFALADTLWIPLGVLLGPLLLLTFPNGRLPTRRWRWVPLGAALSSTTLFAQLFHPRRYDGRALAPYALRDIELPGPLFTAGMSLWMLALAAAGASLIVRYHRSVGDEREQIKWVTFGLVVSFALLALSDVAQRLGGDPAFWGPVASAGFFFLLPLTFLFSVFRYRLFSIDVVINRTLVFGILSLLVALTYVAAIAAAGSLVGTGDLTSAVIAMVITAFAFEPIRVRTVSLLDRFVWRRGSNPSQALSDVLMTIEGRHDLEEGVVTIVEAAAEATGASHVALWVDDGQDTQLVAAAPADTAPSHTDGWDHVSSVGASGAIGVRMARGDRLRRDERRLVDDLASLSGRLFENVQLRSELDAAATELEARHSDLIIAEKRLREIVDQTRAEVERDLHDGAQARAVALASAIGLARVSPSSADAAEMVSEIETAEAAVVSFANGLYPAELHTDGLGSAIRSHARRLLPEAVIDVEVSAVPEGVAGIAYLVASEAMLNVAKHAGSARNAPQVSCATLGSRLEIVVRDYGPGFFPSAQSTGSGLANLRERVEAVGGSLQVESNIGTGTHVRATIPMGT